MKLDRFTPANSIEIAAPRWKDRTVGIASYRVSIHNVIRISYKRANGERLYPFPFYMKGDVIRSYPKQTLPSGVVLYLVPIADLEILEEE